MKLEFLLQFMMPLTFLAIWALTSLLNRDAQPLPPRPGAGRGRGSNRRGSGPAGASRPPRAATDAGRLARRRVPDAEPYRAARWSSATVPGRPSSGPMRAVNEGIVIIESESREHRDHRRSRPRRRLPRPGDAGDEPGGAPPRGAPADARSRPAGRAGTAADPDRPGRPVPGSEAFQAAGDRPALDADDADLVGAADFGLPDARPRGGPHRRPGGRSEPLHRRPPRHADLPQTPAQGRASRRVAPAAGLAPRTATAALTGRPLVQGIPDRGSSRATSHGKTYRHPRTGICGQLAEIRFPHPDRRRWRRALGSGKAVEIDLPPGRHRVTASERLEWPTGRDRHRRQL